MQLCRIKVRGIHHIIFYSLPQNADFYSEILNNIEVQDTSSPFCTVLYSKYEVLQLARVVGSRRAQIMCQSHEPLHMMITHNRTWCTHNVYVIEKNLCILPSGKLCIARSWNTKYKFPTDVDVLWNSAYICTYNNLSLRHNNI